MKLNLSTITIEHADDLQSEFAAQETRSRAARAQSREKRRVLHLAKKPDAPSIGDLLAPGVPHDPRLVMHTSSYDYVIGRF